VGLVRSGVELSVTSLGGFFYAAPVSQRAATHANVALAGYDEEQIRLNSAVKMRDGFFTTFFVSPYSKYLARFAARRGWTPNAITTVSFAIGVLAVGSRGALVAGAVLLQVSFTMDCVDGQTARYTRTFSSLGAWLDSVFDRLKEYVVYAGLALGSVRGSGDDVWTLAAATLVVQTVRHMTDFAWGASIQERRILDPRAPLEQPEDTDAGMSVLLYAPAEPGWTRRLNFSTLAPHIVKANQALGRRPLTRWLKRILLLPIGERFAVISLTTALAAPRTTFLVLLAWGGIAITCVLGARIALSTAE
jgi:hypothetical protein